MKKTVSSLVGAIDLYASDGALTALYFSSHTRRPDDDGDDATSSKHVLDRAITQLEEYFAGTRRVFDLPLGARGTEFQMRVWNELSRIPWGETRSYSDIAVALNNPGAVRAVGTANSRNPISIIVPCHRVVGADGSLRGYAGGEAAKRWLLTHEIEDARVKILTGETFFEQPIAG